ncbi:Nn.00g031560.m01.CDS01 [Neocucurbitaria sp. VM-36]
MASRAPPSPRKKQDGPFINFNKHPDSYLILPYGNTDAKPMHSKTKVFINVTRWIQLALRVCTMLGAVGILLCGIFIRGAQDTEGYIMRIPPGVDIVVCLYAVYHLVRNAKSRPPASSASYHFFALVTDAGFVPFYIFTVLMSRRNSDMEAGTTGRWRTMFPTDDETNTVLTTTWLTATVVAGLHLVSLFLDLYLVIVFRKISQLPPDMNPLEDNLTSRRKSKHKHKTSSISAITPLTGDKEKRFSAQSTISGDRNSQADPLLKDIVNPNKSQVAFLHTRMNSETTYSPHTPNSARQSKERFSMYSQPPSARQSRRDLNHRDDLHRREDQVEGETLAQRKSFLAQQANIKRHSRNDSYATLPSSKQEFYTPPTTARTEKQEAAGDLALQRNSRENLQNDNWFVHPNQDDEMEQEEHYHPAPAPKQSMFGSNQGYNTLSPYDDISDLEEDSEKPMVPQPLRMNPPTPPPVMTFDEKKSTPPPPTLKRTQTTTSISTDATFNRSHSRSGTPKSRYYGDLRAATQGIRSGNSPSNSPNTSPTKGSFRNQPNHLPSATKQYAVNTPPPARNDFVTNSPFTLNKKSYTSVRRTGEANFTPVKGQSPRVVSRSGVDYINPYEFDDSDLGTPGRRRDVSGKIAEEGRGGMWGGMTQRKVSGVA